MYIIEMLKDKTLRTRQRENIYQGDHMESSILFLLPEVYKDMSMRDSNIVLKYKTPDGRVGVEILEIEEELYQGMLQSIVSITHNITRMKGSVILFLTIYNDQKGFPIRFKTTDAVLNIRPKCQFVGEVIDGEDFVDKLMDKIGDVPDNIDYDPEKNELQLSSKGKLIGDRATLRDDNSYWENMKGSNPGDDNPDKDDSSIWERI